MSLCLVLFMLSASNAVVGSAMLYSIKGQSARTECPPGKYRSPNLMGSACLQCTECPPNQIVREICTQDSDTVCSAFFEFEFPLDMPDEQPPKVKADASADDQLTEHDFHSRASSQHETPIEDTAQDEASIRLGGLSYGLISALIVVQCIFVTVVVYFVMLWRNRRSQPKLITVPGDDDPTIYYHAREVMVAANQTADGPATTSYIVVPHVPRGTTITVPSDLIHLEAQVQRNTQRRSLVGQLLYGGTPHSPGNEYVEESFRVRLSSTATNDFDDDSAAVPLVSNIEDQARIHGLSLVDYES